MPRNGSGTMSLTATSVAPAVSSTLIESSDFNTTMQDIVDALTQSLSKDGQTVITGDIDFDGNQIILDADGDTTITADTDDQVDFRLGGTDIIRFKTVASAVNGLDLFGSATGNQPYIQAVGTDSNFGLDIRDSNGNEVLITDGVASAVNELSITNAATGNNPIIASSGADTNIGIDITPKGTGKVTNGTNELTAFPSGTLMLFQQTAAPTGWTKETTHNDKALRIVSGTASSGGSVAFSTVFGLTATDSHTLTSGEIPSHNHSFNIYTGSHTAGSTGILGSNLTNASFNTNNTGSGGGHSHNIDLQVNYVDIIIASKD